MHKLLRCVVTGMFLAGCWLSAQDLEVTEIHGESWLSHLARSFDETSMGKTGRLGPPETTPGHFNRYLASTPVALLPNQPVTVNGAGLYRTNCRGCHGEAGFGAPPEINSVINPVRSSSALLVTERMKTVGMDINPAIATEMASQSKKALLLRLHKGGENMPPFPHLSETEIRALVAYLKQLAGIPGAQSEQVKVQISRIRVGEHIAKSTCHICHAAAGSSPSPEELLRGAIPPLSTLPTRTNLPEFVRKVTQGAPVLMGAPPLLCRGRMPVFGYLTEDEAQDVYLYLTLYPPGKSGNAIASLNPDEPGPVGGVVPISYVDSSRGVDSEDPLRISLLRFALFPSVLFLFLGGVVLRYLPLAVKIHKEYGVGSGAYSMPVDDCPKAVADWTRKEQKSLEQAHSSPNTNTS